MKLIARIVVLLSLTMACLAADAPGFKVVKKYPVPGNGGFDYIFFDASSQRLFVSHGNEVNVLDANSGKVLGKIDNTPGVHGIAIVADLHRGYISAGHDASVVVFDTGSLHRIARLQVDADPDFIFYDPQTSRVFVCHGDASELSVIDPAKDAVIGKIKLDSGAEAAVVHDKNNGFVNLEDTAEVAHFDPTAMTVEHTWPITGCKQPTGLAMDHSAERLFIGCRSRVLAVMDASDGKVITTLPIGDHVDAVAYDPDNKLIFASNGDGTVSVVRENGPNDYQTLGDIQTQKSGKTMTFDPGTKRLFVSAAQVESTPGANGQPPRFHPKPGTLTVLVVEKQ